jgi:D-amino peptidase
MVILFRVLLAALLSVVAVAQNSSRKLKIYISADGEGVAGAVSNEQLGPPGFEYERFRQIMTDDVNAVVATILGAGATEVLVGDAHGNGLNLLIEKITPDPRIRVVRGMPRPLMMMEGIDATFDAAVFLGYHSGSANPVGVRAHTISSIRYTDIRLNGISMPMSGMNAAIAGHFGVPVIFISGDDAAVAEAHKLIGPIESVVLKQAIAFHSANTMLPEVARKLVQEKVRVAMARLREVKPYKLPSPVVVEVDFKNYFPSQILSLMPGVERIGARGIRFKCKDAAEAMRFLVFVNVYTPNLEP